MTLRRSLTVTAVLLALLLAAWIDLLEPVAEWVGRLIHLPITRFPVS